MAPKTEIEIFVIFLILCSTFHKCVAIFTTSSESNLQCNRTALDSSTESIIVGQNFTLTFTLVTILLRNQSIAWWRGDGTRLGCIGQQCPPTRPGVQRYEFNVAETKRVIMSISNVRISDKGKYRLVFYEEGSSKCELLSTTLQVSAESYTPTKSGQVPSSTVNYTVTTKSADDKDTVNTRNSYIVTENALKMTMSGDKSLEVHWVIQPTPKRDLVVYLSVPLVSGIALVISIVTCSFVCGCIHYRHHIKYQYRRFVDYRRSVYDYANNSTQDIPRSIHAGSTNPNSVSRIPISSLPVALNAHGKHAPPLPPRDHDMSIGMPLRGLRAPWKRARTDNESNGQSNTEREYAYARCTAESRVIRVDLVRQVVDENYEDSFQLTNTPTSLESNVSYEEVDQSTDESSLSDCERCIDTAIYRSNHFYEEPILKTNTQNETVGTISNRPTSLDSKVSYLTVVDEPKDEYLRSDSESCIDTESQWTNSFYGEPIPEIITHNKTTGSSVTPLSAGSYNTLKCDVFGTSLNNDFDRLNRPLLEDAFSNIRSISEDGSENYTVCSSRKQVRTSSSDTYEQMNSQT